MAFIRSCISNTTRIVILFFALYKYSYLLTYNGTKASYSAHTETMSCSLHTTIKQFRLVAFYYVCADTVNISTRFVTYFLVYCVYILLLGLDDADMTKKN